MGKNFQRLYTPKARLAFVHIAQPKKNQRGDDRYTCALIFARASFSEREVKLFEALVASVKDVAKDFKGRWRSPFKKGEDMVNRDTGEFYAGFGPGTIFFDASTKFGADDPDHPLLLVGPSGEALSAEDFYSGCFARAKVHAYPYSEGGNKGVSFGLDGLQWLADGERLGGGGSRGFEDAPPLDEPAGPGPARRPAAPSDEAPPESAGAWSGPSDADDVPF